MDEIILRELSQNRTEQVRRYHDFDKLSKNVSAFISNIAAPTSLGELDHYYTEIGQFDVEQVVEYGYNNWTVPKWAKPGDIVFFMHSKTSNSNLTALRTELNNNKQLYSKEKYYELMSGIYKGLALHQKYGGKIISIARVTGLPEYGEIDEDDEDWHCKSRIFADVDIIDVLDNPVDISEFNDFIFVSRVGGITPVSGSEYEKLKNLIKSKNVTSSYFNKSKVSPLPYTLINEKNWITLSKEYRRSFMLENHFRAYYVDYLLREISSIKKIYKECRCRKAGIADSFVDNVIKFRGKYLPVEVKLAVSAEININAQLQKYCHDDEIYLENKMELGIGPDIVYNNRVLVIDTEAIYIYKYEDDTLDELYKLDDINQGFNFNHLKELINDSL